MDLETWQTQHGISGDGVVTILHVAYIHVIHTYMYMYMYVAFPLSLCLTYYYVISLIAHAHARSQSSIQSVYSQSIVSPWL